MAGDRVFIGLGNGKLNRSAEEPAGALLCLDVATGRRLWRCDVGDMVFGTPAVAGDRVNFTSRDRHCYSLDCRDGRLLWKKHLDSALVAAPVLFGCTLYVVATGGVAYSLDPTTGAVRWQFDLARHSQTAPELLSAPAVAFATAKAGTCTRLYLGAGLHYSISSAAVVYCLNPPTEPRILQD